MEAQPDDQRGLSRPAADLRHGRGQAMVEVALLLPVFMLVLLGTIDLGRLFALAIAVDNAAREGASFGAVKPACVTAAACADPGNITYAARQELGGDTGLTVAVTCSPSCTSSTSTDHTITVTASRPFAPLTPFIAQIVGASISPAASATAVIQ